MANQKQDGSNITSAEYSTGRCKTRCEQCFVNFGQQGMATCKGIVRPDRRAGFEFMVREGKRTKLWTPPPPQTAEERQKHGERLGAIRPDAKGFFNIPTQGAWEKWIVEERKQTVKIKTGPRKGKSYPLFLRASSMSDSSWAPGDWINAVRDAWGGYCFFNSAVRAVKMRPANLDLYHKLVVTMNPGEQKVPKMDPRVGLKASQRDDPLPQVVGSMGAAAEKARDFLHPETLEMAGFRGYEDIIKFYRLRALPTVRGPVETDRPVVVTQMRFKSMAHGLEFCRRYGLEREILVPRKQWSATGMPPKKVMESSDRFDVPMFSYEGNAVRLRIWSRKGDKRNFSPYAGEASEYVSEYMWHDSFLRVMNVEAYDADPWVCDRAHQGCKACGLCASLDGTEPGDANPLNMYPPVPGPEGATYLEHNPAGADDEGDFFQDRLVEGMERAGLTANAGRRLRNPGPPAPSLEWIGDSLAAVADYLDKDTSTDADFCEGWNTHEHASALTAMSIWSLMVHAKHHGLSRDEAFDWIDAFVAESTDGADPCSGVGDLVEMWDDDSLWTEQFGPTG